eukprot:Pgem_evm1s2042
MEAWKADLVGNGGYLSLRKQNLSQVDVDGIVEICKLADGLVTKVGLTCNDLGSCGAKLFVSYFNP